MTLKTTLRKEQNKCRENWSKKGNPEILAISNAHFHIYAYNHISPFPIRMHELGMINVPGE